MADYHGRNRYCTHSCINVLFLLLLLQEVLCFQPVFHSSRRRIRQSWVLGAKESLSFVEPIPGNEFSRAIQLGELGRKHFSCELTATEDECALLAERFDLPSIRSFTANVNVRRTDGVPQLVTIVGSLAADVTQRCRTTGRDFPVAVDEDFESVVRDLAAAAARDGEELGPLTNELIDEEVEEGAPLDLGELAAQYLCLAIDFDRPHPEVAGPGSNTDILWESSIGSFDEEKTQEINIDFNAAPKKKMSQKERKRMQKLMEEGGDMEE